MKKINQTPGTVLKDLLKKHGLNCNRLAKAINMSNAMMRLLILDKSPVSVPAALRLAKFFKNDPEYWLILQMKFDLSKAEKNKVLAKEVTGITDVSKFTFVRKPHAKKAGRKAAGKKAAGKGKKKATLADRRKTAGKAPGSRPAKRARKK